MSSFYFVSKIVQVAFFKHMVIIAPYKFKGPPTPPITNRVYSIKSKIVHRKRVST